MYLWLYNYESTPKRQFWLNLLYFLDLINLYSIVFSKIQIY